MTKLEMWQRLRVLEIKNETLTHKLDVALRERDIARMWVCDR